VGRTVWTFAVVGDHFLWADHRQRKVCRGEASEALALPLLQLELSPGAVPQILLGALPVAIPAEAAKGTGGYASSTGRGTTGSPGSIPTTSSANGR
jgi:hypothetical protein